MITEDRWKTANEIESNHWNRVMASQVLMDREDGYYRHAAVMCLQRDNPAGITVCDIGGGPLSLMLHHDVTGIVVDPLVITKRRDQIYSLHNIEYIQAKAEDFLQTAFIHTDEVWMYNCLTHVKDPEYIIRNLRKVSKKLRISEPCNTIINDCHPFSFTPEWYKSMLEELSYSGEWVSIEYDGCPYVGGVWNLK